MNLKKPKFWDYKKPNIYSYILFPLSVFVQIIHFLKTKLNKQKKLIGTRIFGSLPKSLRFSKFLKISFLARGLII